MVEVDLDLILAPIAGENSAGVNLRYDSVYDEIKEARRADDDLAQGDWQHDLKTADWHKVFNLAVETLSTRSKDLQIAVWLFEALARLNGFSGVSDGFQIINGLLKEYWENFYPEIEDDDLDYRIGPLEFLNDKLWLPIKEIPITDPGASAGYSWVNWQESRQLSLEKDPEARKMMIDAGKPSDEDFAKAVNHSSKDFYKNLTTEIAAAIEGFQQFDATVDEKFGREAPRLSELKTSLDDCRQLAEKYLKEKLEKNPDPIAEAAKQEEVAETAAEKATEVQPVASGQGMAPSPGRETVMVKAAASRGAYSVNRLLGSAGVEEAVWDEALAKLESTGIKAALEHLLGASCSAQSVRENSNFRLLTAKLCLKAQRPDLARPIAEELNSLVEELELLKWESPIWIADVLDTLYQCLSTEDASEEDHARATELLTKICTLDVTKAMEHKI